MITTKPAVDPHGWYSPGMAAAALGVDPATIYRWRKRGLLTFVEHRATRKPRIVGASIIRFWELNAR